MSVGFYVMHCPAFPGRHETATKVCDVLSSELRHNPDLGQFVLVRDWEKSGAWATARHCWNRGIERGDDFIVLLNDDALLPVGFVQAATAALEAANARDPRAPVCFYTANERAAEALDAGASFYSTPDGLVGVGCGMHRENVKEFLAWHDANFVGEHTDDGRVNLWAMATGRRILTTLPSLVGHQLPDESTVGNTHHDFRTPSVPPPEDASSLDRLYWQDRPVARFGRQYRGNHWRLLTNVAPHAWKPGGLVERAYALERER